MDPFGVSVLESSKCNDSKTLRHSNLRISIWKFLRVCKRSTKLLLRVWIQRPDFSRGRLLCRIAKPIVPNPLALPQALGETHAAAVGGQKEEEEPRIRIVERWPISEKHCKLICIDANKKRYFSRPERYESRLCYLIYIFTSNPLVDQ
jgi:hypothetical protein